MHSFHYVDFLRHIQRHRITHLQTAPPVLVMLAKRPETSGYDLSSLRNILCGAAPLSKELQNGVSALLSPEARIVQTWGMTEVTCSALHVPGGQLDTSGSVGLLDPNCEIKLLDDDGVEVHEGERGELYIKGPNVCLGYWRNKAATAAAFEDEGFLRTGDVAVRKVDEEGKSWFWIVDRKKELIKVKGLQVAPAELEATLLEHECVADAAVVGVKVGDVGEEAPRAYGVLKGTGKGKGKVGEENLKAWMEGRVGRHKRLEGGIRFVAEVPKSVSGKIMRRVIRAWAEEEGNGKGMNKKELERSKL
jgi:4-coumarate--CoA ligase